MDVSKNLNGIKISMGSVNVFLNPENEVDKGVVIYTANDSLYDTNDERLIIEGPGEYEFQGVTIKGQRKDGKMSFIIGYNDRGVYFTTADNISNIPDDEMYDAAIIEVNSEGDKPKLAKTAYPTIFLDKVNFTEGLDAERVKNVNLKKIVPEEKNIFILV